MLRSVALGFTLLAAACDSQLVLDKPPFAAQELPAVVRIGNPEPAQNAYFGAVMAFDGTSLLVAASGAPIGSVPRAGGAFLHEPRGDSWRTTRIARSAPATGDGELDIKLLPSEAPVRAFPFVEAWPAVRVALSADLAVVSWAGASEKGVAGAGVVCVYDRHADLALRECLQKPAPQDANAWFGLSVALSPPSDVPRRLVVGAPGALSLRFPGERAVNGGAAYVYVERDGHFVLEREFIASSPAAADFFGGSVAIDGDTIAVGAPAEDSPALGPHATDPNITESPGVGIGAVYVYRRAGADWQLEQFLKPLLRTSSAGFFGVAVALDGDLLAIGNPAADGCGRATVTAYPAGAVYVARRLNGMWSMTLDDCHWDDRVPLGTGLGLSIALSDGHLVAGAPVDAQEGELTGAAYVKTLEPDGSSTPFRPLRPPIPHNPAMFGAAVALAGGRLAVGAPREPSPLPPNGGETFSAGGVYVFSNVFPQGAAPLRSH